MLVLELMHFADELADPEKLHVPKNRKSGKREMNMAKALIDSMSGEMEPGKIQGRLSRSADGCDRRKSGRRRRRNRRKTEESTQANENNRFGFCLCRRAWRKPAREEKSDGQIA